MSEQVDLEKKKKKKHYFLDDCAQGLMVNRMHSSWRAVKKEVPHGSIPELVLVNTFASDPQEEMACLLIKSTDDSSWYPQKQGLSFRGSWQARGMGQQETFGIKQGQVESPALGKEETLETTESEADRLVEGLEKSLWGSWWTMSPQHALGRRTNNLWSCKFRGADGQIYRITSPWEQLSSIGDCWENFCYPHPKRYSKLDQINFWLTWSDPQLTLLWAGG